MDLSPFERINPCGLLDMRMTQVADLGGPADCRQVERDLVAALRQGL